MRIISNKQFHGTFGAHLGEVFGDPGKGLQPHNKCYRLPNRPGGIEIGER